MDFSIICSNAMICSMVPRPGWYAACESGNEAYRSFFNSRCNNAYEYLVDVAQKTDCFHIPAGFSLYSAPQSRFFKL